MKPKKPKFGGRKKGTPNKVTGELRQLFKAMLDKLSPQVEEWICDCAKKDPGEAASLVIRMAEFHLPKLARLQLDLKTVPVEEIAAELARREADEADAEAVH